MEEKHFFIRLTDGEKLEINTVSHVESFTEDEVVVAIQTGRLGIDGSDLKIENLNKESGEILIRGKIDGVTLLKTKEVKSAGLFAKLFR